MTSISVIVSTYGDVAEWAGLTWRRALPSITGQTYPAETVHYNHGATLAESRNIGAQQARGEWLCFLDADDELDPMYLEHMAARAVRLPDEGSWLLQPATLGVTNGVEDPFPVVIPRRRLIDANYLVIGTLVRREQFLRVGGFREWAAYEDWDLFLRCWLDGAESVEVPDAIYRVHVRSGSRNNGERPDQVRLYNQIRDQYVAAARGR